MKKIYAFDICVEIFFASTWFSKIFIAVLICSSKFALSEKAITIVRTLFVWSVIIAFSESLVGLPYAPNSSEKTGKFSIFIMSFPIPL